MSNNSKEINVPGSIQPGKPRFELLDGLRGVAAMFVIWYHFGEGFATSPVDQFMNHGYLAVDLFFVLSGFVIGYAYDDRWSKGMTPWRFMLRRVIRLHPMVILSMLLGALAFAIQGSVQWDGTPVPLSSLLMSLALGLFLIPTAAGMAPEVRGNHEMFPLNGPAWSLFFEYIGSIMYAFLLHRLSSRWLKLIAAVSAIGVAYTLLGNATGYYHLGVGWSLDDNGFLWGLFRMTYSFTIGLLMSRGFKARKIRGAFWIATAILAIVFAVPYPGGDATILNGVYDLLCTTILFPIIVYIGACGTTTDRFSTRLCDALGQLSYPVYIVHYPVMYLFYAYTFSHEVTMGQMWPVCLALFVGILLLAWAAYRFYDKPVRGALSRKLLR